MWGLLQLGRNCASVLLDVLLGVGFFLRVCARALRDCARGLHLVVVCALTGRLPPPPPLPEFVCRACGAGPWHSTPGTWGGLTPIGYGLWIDATPSAADGYLCGICLPTVEDELRTALNGHYSRRIIARA